MTREQNRLLDYLDEQQIAAIHGVAGTGKTIMAIEKAINKKKTIYPLHFDRKCCIMRKN